MDKYTEAWPEREFVGYGMDMPDPQWPHGAKVCVSFIVQYYMGAVSTAWLIGPLSTTNHLRQEPSFLNGDNVTCTELMEIPKTRFSKGRYESAEQMIEYGAREGVPRLLSIFKK